MQTADLLGIWKMESRGGVEAQEAGVKISLLQFKDDSKFRSAIVYLPHFLIVAPEPKGLVPETKYQVSGTWDLNEGILVRNSNDQALRTRIFLNGDVLDIVLEHDDGKEVVLVYRRVAD